MCIISLSLYASHVIRKVVKYLFPLFSNSYYRG